MAGEESGASAADAPLMVTVRTIGARPRISPGQRVATVADLQIRVTGGTRGSRVAAKFGVSLNVGISDVGTARLNDETAGSRAVLATRSRGSYVFENVVFPAPGTSATRVFRITNVRANASGISAGPSGLPGTISAIITASGSAPVRLSNAEQSVASIASARARKTGRRRTS